LRWLVYNKSDHAHSFQENALSNFKFAFLRSFKAPS